MEKFNLWSNFKELSDAGNTVNCIPSKIQIVGAVFSLILQTKFPLISQTKEILYSLYFIFL